MVLKPKNKKTSPASVTIEIDDILEAQKQKPEKQVVTLYLERTPYQELQRECGRKVSEVVNQLIKAYLSARNKGA